MATPATVDEFLDLVRKSGVTDERRLDAYVERLRVAKQLPAEPAKLAGLLVRDGHLTHFQAEHILQGKWRRFTIGKYKVLERIGAGGMGSVYLCEHKLMRRRVAIKVLPTAKAKDEAALRRFYREARAAAALDHPNIVHAYDIDQDEDLHFLVMEYVDGSNLQEIVKASGPLDVTRACHYVRQAALGLDHANRSGMVHRDIKPGNILVDRAGTVKILDMGLARIFNDEDDALTRQFDENTLGTADYLAPEQARDSHTVDIRADIYSLGATFYYLLAGRPPFGEGTVAQKLLWHQTRPHRPVTEHRPDVPAAISAIIDKMMAKDADRRYTEPGELAAALEPFTRTPIAPPTDAEMPHLSPAATGHVNEPATETSLPKQAAVPRALQGMGSSATKRPPVVSATTPTPSRTPSPAVGSGPRLAGTAVQTPAPAPEPATPAMELVEPEETPPWERMADTDELSTAVADTSPQGSRSGRRLPPSTQQADARTAFLILAVVGLVSVPFVCVTGALVWYFYPSSPAGKQPTGPAKLIVTQDAGKPNSFRSVQHALRSANPGDTIELHDDLHMENLKVDSTLRKPEVTLRAAPGKKVVWRSASADAGDPIVLLYKAAGFHLKGDGITLDGSVAGGKRVKNLVRVTLESPGLTVEGLNLKNFESSGIFFVNAAGTPTQKIQVSNVTAQLPANDKEVAVFRFHAGKGTRPPTNDHIAIDGGPFPGAANRVVAVQDGKGHQVMGDDVRLPKE